MISERLIQLINSGQLMKFYKSKEWKAVRLQALKRDKNECQSCKRKGKYRKAKNVHHIKEVKMHPYLALDLNNTECICIQCHNEEHQRLEKYIQKKNPKFTNEERW